MSIKWKSRCKIETRDANVLLCSKALILHNTENSHVMCNNTKHTWLSNLISCTSRKKTHFKLQRKMLIRA